MKLLFAGTPEFAAQHLKCLIESEHQVVGVITQPDKPGKRGKKPIPSAVKVLALEEGLTVIQPNKLTVSDISHYDAQAMVVVAYGQILRPPVLETLPFGCINVHGSMLPRWRGAAPIQRAILTGDTQSGVCIIQMNKGLDTGPILASESCEISKEDTSATLALKLLLFLRTKGVSLVLDIQCVQRQSLAQVFLSGRGNLEILLQQPITFIHDE